MQYPGVKTDRFALESHYSEGLIVGYRWYDKHGVKPAFPFGHGLTYGSFGYSNLKVDGRNITFTLKRLSGSGCETPQVYFGYPDANADGKPTKVLRYFRKTCDEVTELSFAYTDADVSNWDVSKKTWKITPGTYEVMVGSSSQDIRIRGSFSVKASVYV